MGHPHQPPELGDGGGGWPTARCSLPQCECPRISPKVAVTCDQCADVPDYAARGQLGTVVSHWHSAPSFGTAGTVWATNQAWPISETRDRRPSRAWGIGVAPTRTICVFQTRSSNQRHLLHRASIRRGARRGVGLSLLVPVVARRCEHPHRAAFTERPPRPATVPLRVPSPSGRLVEHRHADVVSDHATDHNLRSCD